MDINEFTDEDLVEENPVEEIALPPEEPSEISLKEEEIQDEIVVEDFPVEEIPIEEVPIEPEGPESSLDPKVQVYVPKATTYRPGIASYDGKDFLVDPKGKVSLIVDLDKVKENSDTALEKSSEALGKAEEALDTANGIDEKATEALNNSESAVETANDAKSIAEDALEQVIIGEGTKIYENGVLQSSINVDSDIQEQLDDIKEDVQDIQEVIPAQASSENQLADKDFVNSSIASNTANFIGTFANVPALLAYTGTITNNDYAFVVNSERDFASTTEMNSYDKTLLTDFDYGWVPNGSNYDLYRFDILTQTWVLKVTNTAKSDVTLNTAYNRYKAVVGENNLTWLYEYTLNNSSFTADQWAAINSGITAQGVIDIENIKNDYVTRTTNQTITGTKSFTASVSFANNTWNAVGDDVRMGDRNIAGHVGLQGVNGQTGIRFFQHQDENNYADFDFDGKCLGTNHPIRIYNVRKNKASFFRYGGASWIRVGSLQTTGSNRVLGGRIYTHIGYGDADVNQQICDFEIVVNNNENLRGFISNVLNLEATIFVPRLRFIKTGSWTWDVHFYAPQWSSNLISLDYDNNINFYFDGNPENTSSPDGTGALTLDTSLNNENYSSANGGYFLQRADGMLIQWGSLSSSNILVTYPKAFKDNNYSIVACINAEGNARGFAQAAKRDTQHAWIRVSTNNNTYADPVCWMAIGQWK